METKQLDFTLKTLTELIGIDSPGGFTDAAAKYVADTLTDMGYAPAFTKKGGVFCDLGGVDTEDGLLLSAHIDTLGAMVSLVKGNGRLHLTPLGGFCAQNAEAENVRVYARDGRVVSGTIQLANASVHVNGNYGKAERSFDTVECVLDAEVRSADDVRALRIDTGCFVCADPRLVITETGYIKSRFLDDKLSAAILLGYARYLKETGTVPKRRVYLHFTVFEEVGHGGAATMPAGVTEMIAVDMGCVGDGLACTEKDVSICVKDSSGPYSYRMVTRLLSLVKEKNISGVGDVYPYYGSDCSAAQRTFDIRCVVIGPGVYASHGYERSHTEGVKNTFDLLCAYTEV